MFVNCGHVGFFLQCKILSDIPLTSFKESQLAVILFRLLKEFSLQDEIRFMCAKVVSASSLAPLKEALMRGTIRRSWGTAGQDRVGMIWRLTSTFCFPHPLLNMDDLSEEGFDR